LYRVRTRKGDYVLAKAVIVASGVSYGRLNIERLERLQGKGVYYSATDIESRLCQNSSTHVTRGGNSAGQAPMFLSQIADKGANVLLTLDSDDFRVIANSHLLVGYSLGSRHVDLWIA